MAYTGRPPAAAPLTSGDIPDGSVTAADLTNPLTKDAAAVQTLNRTTSDGDIALFQKDGTTVGSIGAYSGRTILASGNTGLRLDGTADAIVPRTSTNGLRTNTIDLGDTSNTFKNLYLGGGVYLGGTGSANYLDDYEEGTWTPTVNYGTVSTSYATYEKIGRQVTVRCFITTFSDRTTNDSITILGLPFTSSSSNQSVGSLMARRITTTAIALTPYLSSSTAGMNIFGQFSGDWSAVKHNNINAADGGFYLSLTYFTNA